MNRTLKAALLGGCTILLAGTASATDTSTLLASNGSWDMRQFDFDSGRVACMMSTRFPWAGVTVSVEAVSGEQRLRLVLSSSAWHTQSAFRTRLDFVFDDAPAWGSDANATMEKDYVVTWIAPQYTPAFVHEFTAGSIMRVTVPGVDPLAFGLTGTTASWGAFMDCAKLASPAIVAAISGAAPPVVAAAPAPAPVAPAVQPAITEVGLLTRYGVKHVQGVAGRSTPLLFILDSGASVVQLPRETAGELALEGALVATGRTATYVNADGVKTVQPEYTLRSLTVGQRTVANVECIVTDRGDALLGQSFLGRLGSWSIDNAKQTLVLGAPAAG